jgi:hypothetical protein
MPGAYAHITLVNLAKEPQRLEQANFPRQAIVAVLDYFRFCELGAVSPDYPYLDIVHRDAAKWADRMHYEKTGSMIKHGVELVRAMTGASQSKALAWLLGYTAHVTADMTIHPIVELKVGRYQENQKAHRVCEMNQDAYIFQRLNVGEVGLSEHLDSGIWGCCQPANSGRLDQAIVSLWEGMLEHCYPNAFSKQPPNLHEWHRAFKQVVDKVEEGSRLAPFARHVAVNCGLTYPSVTQIDHQYIDDLITPQGPMNYDAIFDRAIDNVLQMWLVVVDGIFMAETTYQSSFGNWNLDTGRDSSGTLVFWKGATQ